MALINRKVARGIMKTILENTAAFGVVYAYAPDLEVLDTDAPYCFVRSGGTRQTFESLHKNPADVQLTITVAVPTKMTGWTEADAEDMLDDLDAVVRQAVRDNVDQFGGTGVRLTEAYSVTGYSDRGGEAFRLEERDVFIFYPCGE